MADSASLAGTATADDVDDNVELALVLSQNERAVGEQLQGLQTKVVVDVAAIDGHLAGAVVNANAGNGMLTTASAVEIRLVSYIFYCLLTQISTASGF